MRLDIGKELRYAHARLFTFAVWLAYGRKLAQGEDSPEPAPVCGDPCEAVGGCLDCICTGELPRAPFTGTPYDLDSEED